MRGVLFGLVCCVAASAAAEGGVTGPREDASRFFHLRRGLEAEADDGDPCLCETDEGMPAEIHRILHVPEVRVPGHDLVTSGPGSDKDDRIGDSVHFAVFQVSCRDSNWLV